MDCFLNLKTKGCLLVIETLKMSHPAGDASPGVGSDDVAIRAPAQVIKEVEEEHVLALGLW